MKKLFFTFLLTVLMCGSPSAIGQISTTLHWPEQRVADKKFFALTTGFGLASFVDLRSAFQNKSSGYGVNPIMRPLVNAGKIPAYGTIGGIYLGVTVVGYEAKKHYWKRWYLPAVVGIGTHGVGFAWNISIARQQ